MACGTFFLPLALLVVTAQQVPQTCHGECRYTFQCDTTNLTRAGSGGKIVNIAFGKPAEMSSVDHNPACMAVNGRTTTVFKQFSHPDANCVSTRVGDNNFWFGVDLGRQYTITDITIYKDAALPLHMAGLSVLVENETTNQTCYTFPNSTAGNSVLEALPEKNDITCDPPLTGHKLWLKKRESRDWYSYIIFCEIQVWACKDGLYGHNCAQDCNGNCKDGVACDNYHGTCHAGCREGYTGAKCRCGHCRGGVACDITDRTCPNGCDKGWLSSYCHLSCPAGRYGNDCAERCGQCKDGDACNAETGVCLKGCQSGKKGKLCKTECSRRTYGENCDRQCGHCLNGEICDKVTGHCSACQNNLLTPLCQECIGGTYGENCGRQCGLCLNGEICDKVTGHCSACQNNLLTPLCQECIGGTYGENCGRECGLCLNGEICDKVTGHCSACQNNLLTPLCQVSDESKDVDVGLNVGVFAGGFGLAVILAAMAAAVFFLIRRRTASDSSGDSIALRAPENQIELPVMAAAAAGNPRDSPEDEEDHYEIEDENIYDVAEDPVRASAPYAPVVVRNR